VDRAEHGRDPARRGGLGLLRARHRALEGAGVHARQFPRGCAGAVYGHVLGFIAPNNFTFGDSLVLVSIILLGASAMRGA